jgi:hypothetical protein
VDARAAWSGAQHDVRHVACQHESNFDLKKTKKLMPPLCNLSASRPRSSCPACGLVTSGLFDTEDSGRLPSRCSAWVCLRYEHLHETRSGKGDCCFEARQDSAEVPSYLAGMLYVSDSSLVLAIQQEST